VKKQTSQHHNDLKILNKNKKSIVDQAAKAESSFLSAKKRKSTEHSPKKRKSTRRNRTFTSIREHSSGLSFHVCDIPIKVNFIDLLRTMKLVCAGTSQRRRVKLNNR